MKRTRKKAAIPQPPQKRQKSDPLPVVEESFPLICSLLGSKIRLRTPPFYAECGPVQQSILQWVTDTDSVWHCQLGTIRMKRTNAQVNPVMRLRALSSVDEIMGKSRRESCVFDAAVGGTTEFGEAVYRLRTGSKHLTVSERVVQSQRFSLEGSQCTSFQRIAKMWKKRCNETVKKAMSAPVLRVEKRKVEVLDKLYLCNPSGDDRRIGSLPRNYDLCVRRYRQIVDHTISGTLQQSTLSHITTLKSRHAEYAFGETTPYNEKQSTWGRGIYSVGFSLTNAFRATARNEIEKHGNVARFRMSRLVIDWALFLSHYVASFRDIEACTSSDDEE